jgi:hypothetical protein
MAAACQRERREAWTTDLMMTHVDQDEERRDGEG